MEQHSPSTFTAHRDWTTHRFCDATDTHTVLGKSAGKNLLVVGSSFFGRYPLPLTGRVVIGRSPDCGIVLDERSVSRHHARLTLGSVNEIEDLHSANGTRIGKTVVPGGERMQLAIGQPFNLGSVTLVIQPTLPGDNQPGFLPLATFVKQVDDSLRILKPTEPTAAIVRFRGKEGIAEGALQRAMERELRSADLIGCVRPWEYAVMIRCGGAWRQRIERIAKRLEAKKVKCEVGIAMYPEEGRSAAALLDASSRQIDSCALPDSATRMQSENGPIVEGTKMRALRSVVERISAGTLSVLVYGETGVGKELMAQRVHAMSPRWDKTLVSFNCGALSETLLESELFGHVRGAFTGATQRKVGLLESANGGSVFLDEIGELPMSMQVKLLRVLEERKVRPVGSVEGLPLDIRFISATNRDLVAEIEAGRFRQDLYYRLAGAIVHIPPLRERRDEIKGLAQLFIERASAGMRRTQRPSLSTAAANMLLDYDWPGNVRELRNVMERAVLLCAGGDILPEHLVRYRVPSTTTGSASSRSMRASQLPLEAAPGGANSRTHEAPKTMRERVRREVEEVEKQQILDALAQCSGNQTRAAKLLGISRRTLINRLDAYNVPRPRKRTSQ